MTAWLKSSIVRRSALALAILVAAWSLAASGAVSMVADRIVQWTRPGPATGVVRWSAQDLECPAEASMRRTGASGEGLATVSCEVLVGSRAVRHGPFLELYPDGTTARQGTYARGMQVGKWVRWAPDGKIRTFTSLRTGEASPYIPSPEDLCPPGALHHRFFFYDGPRTTMQSSCTTPDKQAKPVLTGPYVTWDEERAPGGARYALREIITYRDDAHDGPHLVFEGPFGHEALVERETYDNGHLEGESRAFFVDGAPRETRNYRQGQLDGIRVGYTPDGKERWRVTYARGRRVAAEGYLTVANEACPGSTVPTFSADRRMAFCALEDPGSLVRSGPYVRWDADGRVIESGRYENNEKMELWIAPEGVALPPKVSDQVQVAEIELRVGDEAYFPDDTPRQDGKKSFAIWFKDNRTRHYPNPRTQLRGSLVEVYGLPPGSYYMEIDIDANPANGLMWPGDLVGTIDFTVGEGEITRRPAQLLYTLHLLAPLDNDRPIPGFIHPCQDPEPVLPGPVRFAWERPPVESRLPIEYRYRLIRRECDSSREIEVVGGKTGDTELTLELPSSHAGEYYGWSLVARTNGKAIGQLMTFGAGGYGWSLSFRVH